MTQPNVFEETYPTIAIWIKEHGWIALGDQDDFSNGAFIRALDPGGLVWEAELDHPSLDDALRDMEKALKRLMEKNGCATREKKRGARKTYSR
ncbi:hypothetical protein ANRL1_00647 [Anaerolineae bacterium]|nr:hypothetical protein ANRL1_00647 [Anaerolineae bacterium]